MRTYLSFIMEEDDIIYLLILVLCFGILTRDVSIFQDLYHLICADCVMYQGIWTGCRWFCCWILLLWTEIVWNCHIPVNSTRRILVNSFWIFDRIINSVSFKSFKIVFLGNLNNVNNEGEKGNRNLNMARHKKVEWMTNK